VAVGIATVALVAGDDASLAGGAETEPALAVEPALAAGAVGFPAEHAATRKAMAAASAVKP
jgi:hypothetical protein